MRKIKRNFERPIHEFCSKSDTQGGLNHVIIEDGFLVATDAHVLVRQSLELHPFDADERALLEGCCFHREVFKEILKYDCIFVKEDGIHAKKGKVNVVFPLEKEINLEYRFPNYKSVLPGSEQPLQEIDSISFDLNLISRVSKVTMGSNGICDFKFYGKNKGCILSGRALSDHIKRKVYEDEVFEVILIMPFGKR